MKPNCVRSEQIQFENQWNSYLNESRLNYSFGQEVRNLNESRLPWVENKWIIESQREVRCAQIFPRKMTFRLRLDPALPGHFLPSARLPYLSGCFFFRFCCARDGRSLSADSPATVWNETERPTLFKSSGFRLSFGPAERIRFNGFVRVSDTSLRHRWKWTERIPLWRHWEGEGAKSTENASGSVHVKTDTSSVAQCNIDIAESLIIFLTISTW